MQLYAQDFTRKYNSSNGKWAILHLTEHDTTLITDYIFDYLPNYDWSGNFIASANNKWFFMNKKLKVFSDSFDYVDTLAFEYGLFHAKLGDYWYIYNYKNALVKDGKIHDTDFFYVFTDYEKILFRKKNNKIYLLRYYTDKWAEAVQEFYTGEYNAVGNFMKLSQYYYPVKKKYWGYIDIHGNTKIPFQYLSAEGFQYGRALVNTGKGWGFIDTNASFLIEPKFSDAKNFMRYPGIAPLAPVAKNSLWGYIDTAGNTIIDFIYDEANYFSGKEAWVKYKGKYGTIGLDGKNIIPFVYDYLPMRQMYDNYIAIKNGKYGLIDAKGSTLIDFNYDYISSQTFNRGNLAMYIVIKSGKYGLIRPFRGDERDIIIPFEYDRIDLYHDYSHDKHIPYLKLKKGEEMFEYRGGTGVIKVKRKKKKKL